jgi:hypothetical protein
LEKQEPTDITSSEITNDSPALLCTVGNHIELTAIESLLRYYHIPVMKKWHNAGDLAMVYMGASFSGADVFVPSKLLEKAKELLADRQDKSDGQSHDEDIEFVESIEKQKKIRRNSAQIILVLFIFVIVVILALIMFNT